MYRKALLDKSVVAQVQLALMGIQETDSEKLHNCGVRGLLHLSIKNIHAAQYYLGYAYEMGMAVMNDFDAAFRYYKMAADAGHLEACNRLGTFYEHGVSCTRDLERAASMYLKCVQEGSLGASNLNLAAFYMDGTYVEEDYSRAVELYTKAAEYGVAEAQSVLGYCYFKGVGNLEKDVEKAFKWTHLAACEGVGESCTLLGYFYQIGWGHLRPNIEKAAIYYKKGSDLGDACGQKLYADLLKSRGEFGVFRLYVESAQYYFPAGVKVGECHEAGVETSVNVKKAIKYYVEAAKYGDPAAFAHLARLHRDGEIVEKDLVKAEWFAEHGSLLRSIESSPIHSSLPLKLFWPEQHIPPIPTLIMKGRGCDLDILNGRNGNAKLESKIYTIESDLDESNRPDGSEDSSSDNFEALSGSSSLDSDMMDGESSTNFINTSETLSLASKMKLLTSRMREDDAMHVNHLEVCEPEDVTMDIASTVDKIIKDDIKVRSHDDFQEEDTAMAEDNTPISPPMSASNDNDSLEYVEIESNLGYSSDTTSESSSVSSEFAIWARPEVQQDSTTTLWNVNLPISRPVFKATRSKDLLLYQKAAIEEGNVTAQCLLGECYETGDGVEQDMKKAISLYQKSAKCGCRDGLYNLALCYLFGRGVKANISEASRYLESILKDDHFDEEALALMSSINPSFNIESFSLAKSEPSQEDYAPSRIELSDQAESNHLKKDEESLLQVRQAAKEGKAWALFQLGKLHQFSPIHEDLPKANEYYEEAVKKGACHVEAMFYLADNLYYGFGKPKDRKLAVDLYKIAASRNHKMATIVLMRLKMNGEVGCAEEDGEIPKVLFSGDYP